MGGLWFVNRALQRGFEGRLGPRECENAARPSITGRGNQGDLAAWRTTIDCYVWITMEAQTRDPSSDSATLKPSLGSAASIT